MKAGELDNTTPGWTIGWLELEGVDGRLQLKLAGNCHPDLAGWKFRIRRFEPELSLGDDEEAVDCTGINLNQSGHGGDITADQVIKHFEVSHKELAKRLMAGENPAFVWRKVCTWNGTATTTVA
ncbi:MAG: hypothetical protein FJ295_11015 [Planctomycetes bacterium]|nr:hypothetical protein [Planctomycetota bacterium]